MGPIEDLEKDKGFYGLILGKGSEMESVTKKLSVPNRLICVLLSLVLVFGFTPITSVQNAQAATNWTSVLSSNYKNAASMAGRSNFNGVCPGAVWWQLRAYGILKSGYGFGANGVDVHKWFKGKAKTDGGYSVSYSAGSGSYNALNLATSSGKNNGFYVISYTSNSTVYGHVNLVVIENGTVYFCDNYTYYGKPEGTCHSFTYANFVTAMKKMYPTVTGVARLTAGSVPETVKEPSYNVRDVYNGKSIGLWSNTSGSTVRYTLDGKTDPSPSTGTVYTQEIRDDWPIMGVRAIAYKSGAYNSSILRRTLYVDNVGNPTISVSETANGTVVHMSSATSGADIVYTTDGSDPAINNWTDGLSIKNGNKFTSDFVLTENCTIKAMSVKKGMSSSKVVSKNVVCAAPAMPVVSLTSSKKIAVNDAAQVSWKAISNASSYTAALYDSDGKKVDSMTTSGTVAAFTPSEVGEYSVKVVASNKVGDSSNSEPVKFQIMADCTVRFVDGADVEKVYDVQTVRYGYDASKPNSPKKKGFTFDGWNGSLKNITEDVDIKASWDRNTYVIQFFDSDGTTRLSRQVVEYESAAKAPSAEAPTGYVFSGWAVVDASEDSTRDYKNVDSDMKLRAVYSWEREQLPVVAQIANAERTASGNYSVDVKLTNWPTGVTTGILRVSLKTADGKLVQTARETVEIGKGSNISKTITLKYTGDYVASVAEAVVVGLDGNYRTGGTYSQTASAQVVCMDNFYYDEWSEWSTTKPAESETVEVESKTQYRYADKQFTSSTASSMSGWTQYDSVTSYGSWSGNQTSTTKPTASDPATLNIINTKTEYVYWHYCNYYDGAWQVDSKPYGSDSHYCTMTFSSMLTDTSARSWGDKGGQSDKEFKGPACGYKQRKGWWFGWNKYTYTYQTRSKTVTYKYWKWGDWSDWSDTASSSTDNRQVEKQTLYRYRTKHPGSITGEQDSSGKTQSVSGKLTTSENLSGKTAVVMVYNATNSDPNEDQMQFIGETTIGDNNAYAFEFKPKSDPTADSGDFIVSLGIEGANGLVNVATIEAPQPKHTVTYQYADEKGVVHVIETQSVDEGADAVVPEAPAREGYTFAGWSRVVTKVNGDVTVSALYVQDACAIAWVDWANDSIQMQTAHVGDAIVAAADDPVAEGYTFKGWKVVGSDSMLASNAVVRGNTVVEAVYEANTYTVTFQNEDGTAFNTQTVAYGESAKLPDSEPVSKGKVFQGWSTVQDAPWWKVKANISVAPIFTYAETTDAPVITCEEVPEEGMYVSPKGFKVEFETVDQDAVVYYTIDGTDPVVPSDAEVNKDKAEVVENTTRVYNSAAAVVIKEPTQLKAMAVSPSKNESCYTAQLLNVAATNNIKNADIDTIEPIPMSGEPIEPYVAVWFNNEVLEPNVDYTVSYINNTQVGTATAMIRGIGEYVGSRTFNFDIVEEATFDPDDPDNRIFDLSECSAALEYDEAVATGSELRPAVSVKDADGAVVNPENYNVVYSDNIEPGIATVTITGAGDYIGEIIRHFTIEKLVLDLTECTASLEYTTAPATGEALFPGVTVKNAQGTKLVKGKDYEVSYSNNVEPGKATVTITGIGDYSGELIKHFTIEGAAVDIASCSVSLEYTTIVATGNALKPEVIVKNAAGVTLVQNTDYEVTYSSNIEPGTAKVVVSGIGDYAGEVTKRFTIEERIVDLSDCSASLEYTTAVATGDSLMPEVTVRDSYGAKLVVGKNYKVAYSNNIEPGEATVTISGIGSYTGQIVKHFTIVKPATSISECSISLEYTHIIATGSALKPEVVVKDAAGNQLVSGRDYSVSYANNVEPGEATVIITGIGNYKDEVIGHFDIEKLILDISKCTASLEYTKIKATGDALMPDVVVKNSRGIRLILGEDFEVSYADNIEPGEATVIISGIGDYNGEIVKHFIIEKDGSSIDPGDEKKPSAIVLSDKTAVYSGVAIEGGSVAVAGSKGAITYQYFSDLACTQPAAPIDAGTYYVKATVAADGEYAAATSAVAVLKIEKATQVISSLISSKTLKYSTLKKKSQVFVMGGIAETDLTYVRTGYANAAAKKYKKYFTFSDSGSVTVKKGLKKGTYKFKISVTAASSKNYLGATASKTLKITVK